MASFNHNTETQFTNPSSSFSVPPSSSPVDAGDKIRRSSSFPGRDSEKTGSGQPKFRTVQPVPLPISSSSLSAPELRDSPFLFNTSNILPSPTTGAFPYQTHIRNSSSIHNPDHSSVWSLQESLKANSAYLSSQSISSETAATLQTSNKEKNVNFQSICGSYQQQTHSDRNHRKSIDGHNWKKYGQKQVKGSQNLKSYFKCTYPNCPTTKKVERSLDGQVTQIVYRGKHNHPKAQSTRRPSSYSSSSAVTSNASQVSNPRPADTLDRSFAVHRVGRADSVATSENSSVSFDHGNFGENCLIQKGGLGIGGIHEIGLEEPDAKRWKESCGNEETPGAGSGAVSESRVVVRTTSDIDVLDDGYRWRKYGQKVVKGNPNPRSYYKCTSPGCLVRKHVERAADDLRAVITTYEGKHKHAVPLTRRSSHSVNRTLERNDNVKMFPVSESQVPFSLEFVPRNLGFLGSENGNNGAFSGAKDESKNKNGLMFLESLLD